MPFIKDCTLSGKTSAYLVDTCAPSPSLSITWNPPVRHIAVEGKPLESGKTDAERKLALFRGRFGEDMTNEHWQRFEKIALDTTWPFRKLSSAADREINEGLAKMVKKIDVQSAASPGLGDKGWWGKNDPEQP